MSSEALNRVAPMAVGHHRHIGRCFVFAKLKLQMACAPGHSYAWC